MELALRQGCCIQWRPSGCISAPPLLYSTPCTLLYSYVHFKILYSFVHCALRQYLGTHLQVLCAYAHCALRLYSCNSYMFTLREDLPKKVLFKQNSAKQRLTPPSPAPPKQMDNFQEICLPKFSHFVNKQFDISTMIMVKHDQHRRCSWKTYDL